MPNVLSPTKQAFVLSCLVEGMGIRATSRVTGCHKTTILRLLCAVGTWASSYCDHKLRNLTCRRLELDEAWSFVYVKEKRKEKAQKPPPQAGDVWTWVAFDPDSKLVASWRIGDRTSETALEFLKDLKGRLAHRVQLTSDGLKAYVEAVDETFGAEVDFAMLAKIYANSELEIKAERIMGQPELEAISTSGVERQNLTMRMSMRRFTRRTNGFSKLLRNHAHAIALHYLYYNFCRIHQSIEITPAMAAGVTDHLYDIDWIVEQVARTRPKPKRPAAYRKISK